MCRSDRWYLASLWRSRPPGRVHVSSNQGFNLCGVIRIAKGGGAEKGGSQLENCRHSCFVECKYQTGARAWSRFSSFPLSSLVLFFSIFCSPVGHRRSNKHFRTYFSQLTGPLINRFTQPTCMHRLRETGNRVVCDVLFFFYVFFSCDSFFTLFASLLSSFIFQRSALPSTSSRKCRTK